MAPGPRPSVDPYEAQVSADPDLETIRVQPNVPEEFGLWWSHACHSTKEEVLGHHCAPLAGSPPTIWRARAGSFRGAPGRWPGGGPHIHHGTSRNFDPPNSAPSPQWPTAVKYAPRSHRSFQVRTMGGHLQLRRQKSHLLTYMEHLIHPRTCPTMLHVSQEEVVMKGLVVS